ncbi:MAG TPA: ABC transporter permease [Bryobacteraceae bacterium]|nr:ABC transporter permease [Bryobacteraceae bacterium]
MLSDLRYALRQLLKSPGFFAVAVLTLALAVGANTAIFSAIDAVLLHPLSYPSPDQLVMVVENMEHYSLSRMAPSAPEFKDVAKWSNSLSQFAAVTPGNVSLYSDGQAEDLLSQRITASAFTLLQVKPVLGGLFSEENEHAGSDHIVIISRALWMKRFGADRSIVGRKIELNRETYQVAGVIDPILDYRATADVWTPLVFTPQDIEPGSSRPHNVDVIARLKPGVTLEQARAELQRVSKRFGEQYAANYPANLGFSLEPLPLSERQAGNLKTPLLVLIAAVGALMLIACANISNLLLARAMLRRKEMSIRAALGAARSRVIRQLLTESLLLAVIGGGAGILLALYALRLYTQFGPQNLIHGTQPALNGWVMAFSLLISIAASMIFGVAPAIDTSRTNLADALKEGARGSSGGRRLLRESMVAAEVAISLILLIGAGLLIRSFVRLANTNPGFRTENVLSAIVSLPASEYGTLTPTPEQHARRVVFIRSWLERVRALPGVVAAGSIDFVQFNGGIGSSIFVVNHPPDANAPTQVAYQSRVSPGYLQTMGVPILRGRDFTPADETGSYAIVDATLVKKFFGNLDPIGQQVSLPIPGGNFTVIGVAGATKFRDLAADPVPRAYYFGPHVAVPVVTLMIQSASDPTALTAAIRHETARLDPSLPVTFKTMEEIVADSFARQRFAIQLMAVFSALAALLAAIGIYGVLAYLVDQRRRELGIRKALGAREADVIGLVLRQGSIPVGAGVAIGIAGAFGLTRLLKSLLYQVSATDPLIFAILPIALLLVALLAMAVPARRAASVDPLVSLREE